MLPDVGRGQPPVDGLVEPRKLARHLVGAVGEGLAGAVGGDAALEAGDDLLGARELDGDERADEAQTAAQPHWAFAALGVEELHRRR